MSFLASVISSAARSLSCSPQEQPGRGVPCRVNGSASRQGRLTAPLGEALIRKGGGYNGKAVSKTSPRKFPPDSAAGAVGGGG